MPNRLSRILSRNAKEKEVEAERERVPESPSPPPGYAPAEAPQYDPEDAIDPPDVTAGFNQLNLNEQSGDIPQVSQTIAHLKLLECFYKLRQTVGSTDGLYSINDAVITDQNLSDEESKALLTKLAEKRWAVYVSCAVERFEKWSAALFPSAKMAKVGDLESLGKEDKLCHPSNTSTILKFTSDNLPPVDVLMVWHAYMLNPRAYLEDCLRLGRMGMWHAPFPWQPVVDSIDNETFVYNPGESASRMFTESTDLPWEDNDDAVTKKVECPNCNALLRIRYTQAPELAPKPKTHGDKKSLGTAIDSMLSEGKGYCDNQFVASCGGCQAAITHDRLRAKKFRHDVRLLLTQNVPMGGTVLGIQGLPWAFETEKDLMCSFTNKFPNDLIRAGLGEEILKRPGYDSRENNMRDIRIEIDSVLHDRLTLRKVPGVRAMRLNRTQRISIRRMMSRYWDNSSPLALDLVGAVIRQGDFIEKMHNIDWLHSPALPSTMKRLLLKYQRFVTIMANPSHMACPTLDVDLAWHTHQLSPYNYMKYTVHITKQFIDHDDKVAETKLNDAFAWTSKTYQKTYGEPYSECTCWYCEAVRESHTSAASRLFSSNSAQANERLPLHDAEQDPRKSVHISAHNAVRPEDSRYVQQAALKAKMLERQYEAACSRARRKGRPVPKRDDYYYSDAYGYPVFIPAYSPYLMMGYMYTPMYYGGNPGCMALGSGAYGNCCSGTCGGGVAAGACAAGGGGACAGGAAGGCCGGAAGGGACGGGGGGGCGGGGGGGGCGGGGGG